MASPSVGDPRFFPATGPHCLAQVAQAAGCALPDAVDGDHLLLSGLSALETAGPTQVSFLATPRHAAILERTQAGAVLVTPEMLDRVPAGTVPLVVADPCAGWSRLAALFHPKAAVKPGIHASAVVAETATIHGGAEICAQAVIGEAVEIGANSRIGPGAVIDDGVVIGPDCQIGAHVTISHAVLGARVRIFPGARIGQEGFGFTIASNGFVTTPQLGRVLIGDDVEIGANTTIDRGALRDTVIGAGTRLDNLVQIAHNVHIGRFCAIAAQVGVSGSAQIGDFVVIGGQAGVADHITIGSKVRIGAQSGVMNTLEDGVVVVSSPARPVKEVFREIATLKKLARRPS